MILNRAGQWTSGPNRLQIPAPGRSRSAAGTARVAKLQDSGLLVAANSHFMQLITEPAPTGGRSAMTRDRRRDVETAGEGGR
ncbi:MAG: hypothetical protein L0H23_10060 [Luteimonas sp.]|nr:hypothetical protein [Luteimonas sp.]